jgi:hypothetical protein
VPNNSQELTDEIKMIKENYYNYDLKSISNDLIKNYGLTGLDINLYKFK